MFEKRTIAVVLFTTVVTERYCMRFFFFFFLRECVFARVPACVYLWSFSSYSAINALNSLTHTLRVCAFVRLSSVIHTVVYKGWVTDVRLWSIKINQVLRQRHLQTAMNSQWSQSGLCCRLQYDMLTTNVREKHIYHKCIKSQLLKEIRYIWWICADNKWIIIIRIEFEHENKRTRTEREKLPSCFIWSSFWGLSCFTVFFFLLFLCSMTIKIKQSMSERAYA